MESCVDKSNYYYVFVLTYKFQCNPTDLHRLSKSRHETLIVVINTLHSSARGE